MRLPGYPESSSKPRDSPAHTTLICAVGPTVPGAVLVRRNRNTAADQLICVFSTAGATCLPIALESSDNVTARAATLKGVTTADPLRRLRNPPHDGPQCPVSSSKSTTSQGIDNEWADALSRKKDSIKDFFPPEQRFEFAVNDLLCPGRQPMRGRNRELSSSSSFVKDHGWLQTSETHVAREPERRCARVSPHGKRLQWTAVKLKRFGELGVLPCRRDGS